MIRDKNKQIVDITHCPLFCDILNTKTRDEREEIYENNYYNLQLVSYELEKYHKLEEQLGCSLDELVLIGKIIKNDQIVYIAGEEISVGITSDLRQIGYYKGSTYYRQPLSNYKKTFWLKEDKSE